MTAPADLVLERLPLDQLLPDPANPGRIADEELDGLTRSMATFGAVEPILIRRQDGLVIGGHQRLVAACRAQADSTPRRCAPVHADGRPCGAPQIRDADRCFWHHPDKADEVADAQRLGCLRRKPEKT